MTNREVEDKNNYFLCNDCNSQIIDKNNQCDFCHKKLCTKCIKKSNFSFESCIGCERRWCILERDGESYKCLNIVKMTACDICGI